MRDPYDFESAMSVLALGIAGIERNAPQTPENLHRLRLLVSRIDTATTRASRRMETENAR